ncbi:hypothetical protein OEZ86_004908 [Tetradesmus obliquus]|nr:hypothetical protein OEZ86_004908 [Tetradesmus obliquus]
MCTALQAMQHELDPSEVVADEEMYDPMDCSAAFKNPAASSSQLTHADLALLQQLRPGMQQQQPCCSSLSSNQYPCSPSTPRQPPTNTAAAASNAPVAAGKPSAAAAAGDLPALRGDSSSSGSGGSSSIDEADGWPDDTLSPPDDPLRFLRQLLQDGPLPWAASITLPELQQQYLSSCREGLLHLTLLDNQQHNEQQPAQAQQSLAVVKQLLQQHLHRWTSLLVYGRSDLLYQFHLTNCLTGVQMEQQDMRPYQAAARQLGLTRLQKQRIAEGFPVFKQLQQVVLDELQQLQQQPADEAGGPAHSWDEWLHQPQLPMGMVQSTSSWQLAQQRNRQRTQRLHMLLRKQHLIGACCNAYMVGCMTHLQAAKLGQFTFPFPAFMFHLGQEVVQLVQQEAQQQQQLLDIDMAAAAPAPAGAAAAAAAAAAQL